MNTLLNIVEEIENFHLPRWRELPNVDLYLDQVVSLLESYLSDYINEDNDNKENFITKSMINNYVKHNVIKPPINKKYNKEHLASLFVIFTLKQIYSMEDIKKLIKLAIETSSTNKAYDLFCCELEKSIKLTFSGESYLNHSNLTQEQYILRNVVQSFSNRLYVKKVFLKKHN